MRTAARKRQKNKGCPLGITLPILSLVLLAFGCDQFNGGRFGSVCAFVVGDARGWTTRAHWIATAESFLNVRVATSPCPLGWGGGALFAKKGKLSAAERKKKRARRQQAQKELHTPMENPKTATTLKGSSTTKEQGNEDEKGDLTKKRAAKLIQDQRNSVAMLTLVRERVEALPYDEIVSALYGTKGFFVVDNFLGDKSIVDEMYSEGLHMLNKNKLQLENIGSGIYGTLLQGGKDGYADSPRCVEFVVSVTRHLPPMFNDALKDATESGAKYDELDNTASMGNLRTFDRKAQQAALELLSAQELDADKDEKDSALGCVTGGDLNDTRRVTLIYYLPPLGWDSSFGGGLRIQPVAPADQGTLTLEKLEPKRDRLIIFLSDKTLQSERVWRGSEQMTHASCISLHLVRKSTQ